MAFMMMIWGLTVFLSIFFFLKISLGKSVWLCVFRPLTPIIYHHHHHHVNMYETWRFTIPRIDCHIDFIASSHSVMTVNLVALSLIIKYLIQIISHWSPWIIEFFNWFLCLIWSNWLVIISIEGGGEGEWKTMVQHD